MSGWRWLLYALIALAAWGCSHREGSLSGEELGSWSPVPSAYDEPEEAVCSEGGTFSARIWVLIAKGEFAQAEALIAEGTAAGLISKPVANRMLERISLLNTKLGQLPASLQRAPDFPSQLKDHTLFEIKQMLDRKDFSLATKAQLNMVKKLLQEPDRLLQKMTKVR